jgi:hypothetical protein
MQRKLFRHGFGILTAGFGLGAVVGAMGGGPHARLWLGSHVTCLLTGLLVIGVAAGWPHFQLGARARRTVYALTAYGNWFAVVMLGVVAPATGFPSKISTPDLPPPPAWASAVVGLSLVVVTLSTFAMCALVLYGLRGASAERLDAVTPAPAE